MLFMLPPDPIFKIKAQFMAHWKCVSQYGTKTGNSGTNGIIVETLPDKTKISSLMEKPKQAKKSDRN